MIKYQNTVKVVRGVIMLENFGIFGLEVVCCRSTSHFFWFCGFFADVTGKMRMRRTQYYKLKKHIHFVEIFIVGITLRAIYVRHKTSHRRKSRVNGGTGPPEFILGTTMMFVPQNSAHIMYLTTRYVVYLYLFAQGIMYYIAFNTGSVWSS